MKPTKTFRLAKTTKRILATITDPIARNEYKQAMIQAQLVPSQLPKKEK